MPGLPSGVVTFLLTDVVDSSALWDAHPAEMAQALSRHDAIVRQAVETYGGMLLKARGEGDSTFSVFARATSAVQAVRAVSLAMEVEAWPAPTRLRLRMSVHTGEALERDGDFYGPTVNRVARMREIADGGQILLSQATVSLALDHLPSDCSVEALGERELRGLKRTETLYSMQVAVPSVPTTTAPEPSHRIPLPTVLSSPPMPGFHGREGERATLLKLLKESTAGARRFVFVAGEAGVGKSALAADLARAAHAQGGTVLYGASEEDAAIGYGPWAQALGSLVSHSPAATPNQVGPRRQADLLRLLPEMSVHVGFSSSSNAVDVEAAQYMLFAAVVAALADVAQTGPLVIVLDDLQWADGQTLRLLRHVMTLADGPPMLVIANYRDSDLGSEHPLNDVLASSRRHAGVERLTLTGLSQAELLCLMEAVAGQSFSGRERTLVQAVHGETDGNPFFAWEIMLHLSETGMVALDEAGRWIAKESLDVLKLPESIREVIGRRVVRLGTAVRHVLDMASVVGSEASLEVLALALDEDEEQVLLHLESAEAAGLLRTSAHGMFSFAHELIGHSVYASMSQTRRTRAHHRVAEALERLGDTSPAELARHWSAGGARDWEHAIECAERAADEALNAYAPHEALRWYESALARLLDRPSYDDHLMCRLQVGVGKAQAQVGDPAFRRTLLNAAAMARACGDPKQLVAAALANTRGFPQGQDDEVIAVLEAAIEAVTDEVSAERARLRAALVSQLIFDDDMARRRAIATDAIAEARASGEKAALLHVLNLVAPAVAVPETLLERHDLTREAVELADALDDPVMQCMARLQLTHVVLESGNVHEADRCLSEMRAIADRLAHPVLQWTVAWARCSREIMAGNIELAEQLAAQALQLGTDTGQPDAFTIYSGQLFCIRWHQGQDIELLELMADVAVQRPDLPILQAAVARLQMDAGRPQPCEPSMLRAVPNDVAWAGSMAVWGEVAAASGTREACQFIYSSLSPYPAHVLYVGAVFLGAVSHYLGLLAAALENPEDARAHFAAAVDVHQSMEAPFHLARTQLQWARLLLSAGLAGDRTEALRLLHAAQGTAKQFGCTRVERQAAELLAAQGIG